MVGDIRADWFTRVVRECQVFIGEAVPLSDRPLRQVLATFTDRVPPPTSSIERLVLRGFLLEILLRWGETHHRSYHGGSIGLCTFRSAELTSHVWRSTGGDPRELLSRWASVYSANFVRAHPLSGAVELRQYLDRHFAQPIPLQSLAKWSQVSVRRIQRDFQALTGQTIKNYIAARRVAAAVHLLETTDEKVEWIAKTVGWCSRKNLNRALARVRGITPQELRRPDGVTARRQTESIAERSRASDRANRRHTKRRRL